MLFDCFDLLHYKDYFNRAYHYNVVVLSVFLTIVVLYLICHKTPRQSENLKFYLITHQIMSCLLTFTCSMASQFITSYPLCVVITLGPLHNYGISTLMQTATFQTILISTSAISCVSIFYRYQCLLPVNSSMKIRQKYLKIVLFVFFITITLANTLGYSIYFFRSKEMATRDLLKKEPHLAILAELPNIYLDVCVPNSLYFIIVLLATITIIFSVYFISLYGSYKILRKKNNFRSEKTRKMQISHTIALVIQMVFPSFSLGIPGFYITISTMLDIRTEYDRAFNEYVIRLCGLHTLLSSIATLVLWKTYRNCVLAYLKFRRQMFYKIYLNTVTEVCLFHTDTRRLDVITLTMTLNYSIEVIVHLIGLVLITILFIRYPAITRFAHFHTNLCIILWGCASFYVPIVTTRFILIAYEIKIIPLSASSFDALNLLIISSFLRIFFITCTFAVIPMIIFERCFATYFISNYERRQRLYIPVFIFLLCIPVCFVLAFITSSPTKLRVILKLMPLMSMISQATFVPAIYFANRHIKKKYENNNDHYSVSSRFQVTENIRVLKGLYPILGVSLFVLSFMTYFTPIDGNCDIIESIDTSMRRELLIALAPLSIFIFVLVHYDPKVRQWIRIVCCRRDKRLKDFNTLNVWNTEAHFKQLMKAWQ